MITTPLTAVADTDRRATNSTSRKFAVARHLKTLAGLLSLGLAAWGGFAYYRSSTSVEAVVVARITVLRSPIDGTIDHGLSTPSVLFADRKVIARVVNERHDTADDARLRDLEVRRDVVAGEIASSMVLVERLSAAAGTYQGQRRLQTLQQVKRLRLLTEQAEAAASAEASKEAFAVAKRTRAEQLAAQGLTSQSELEIARTDEAVAHDTASASTRARDLYAEALKAARAGMPADPYGGSDITIASQRAEDVGQRLLEAEAVLESKQALQKTLDVQIDTERKRVDTLASAELYSFPHARLWQVYAARGEYVRNGQDVIALANCDDVFVEAFVTERTLARVRTGTRARFKLRATGTQYEGQVVQVRSAMQTRPETLPDARLDESTDITAASHRFVVLSHFPKLSTDLKCDLGQTGEVTFGADW